MVDGSTIIKLTYVRTFEKNKETIRHVGPGSTYQLIPTEKVSFASGIEIMLDSWHTN